MVIPLAAGEVGGGTQGRSLPARDGAAWVLRPWRPWLAILLQQRERGINARLLPSSRLAHELSHLEVSRSQSLGIAA